MPGESAPSSIRIASDGEPGTPLLVSGTIYAPDGETRVELEEAFVTTTSLPHDLQVKVGQFLTEFGRINPTHPHTWDFVDAPLVTGRMLGPEGLRSAGVRASWLMPLP